jgi:hypothetical protein
MDDASPDLFMARGILSLEVKSFQAVGERIMPDVVEQTGGEHRQQIHFADRLGEGLVTQQALQIPLDTPVDPEAMLEAGVGSSGVDQVDGAEHAHPSQSLKGWMIDDRHDAVRDGNVAKLRHADASRWKPSQAKLRDVQGIWFRRSGVDAVAHGGARGLQGVSMNVIGRLEQAVIDQMRAQAGHRLLSDEWAIATGAPDSTVGDALLWVKPDAARSWSRLVVTPEAPAEPSGWLELKQRTPSSPGQSSRTSTTALVEALLGSRLLGWYLQRCASPTFEGALASLPWPEVPADLADQLTLLSSYRRHLASQRLSVQPVDEAIERVVVEIYALRVEHLITLDRGATSRSKGSSS